MFDKMTADEFRAQPDYAAKYYELLGAWRADKGELAKVKDREMAHRVLLANLTFADPEEGTQHYTFGADKKKDPKLTLQHVINRKIDPAAVGACLATLRATIGAKADEIVEFKPDLRVGEYKKLTEEQKAILAPAITASPGSPQLKYVEGKDD